MIQKIVNSTIMDGQFQDCPLTVKDLYIIAESFQTVMLGIYHHRVEYPDTRAISRGEEGAEKPPPEAVITLELPALEELMRNEKDESAPDPASDYESVQNLPGLDPTEESPADS